jgi:hypothetical protein
MEVTRFTEQQQERANKWPQLARVAWNLRAAVVDFLLGGDSNDDTGPDERVTEDIVMLWDANAISSQIVEKHFDGRKPTVTNRHKIAIDLDCSHVYVPSTTPGHGHLIVDVDLSWYAYENLLEHLARVGVLEPGYVSAAKHRKATWLRTPWTRKDDNVEPYR